MFQLESQQDVKSLVSGLRRELKRKDIELSHNQLLDAVAKALGLSGAEELSARMPKASMPISSVKKTSVPLVDKYPLSNTGQFDFAEQGTLYVGVDFCGVAGTSDDIRKCTAFVESGSRTVDGAIDPEYAGDTEVNWTGQLPNTDSRGVALYFTEDGAEVPSDHLVLVPEVPAGTDFRRVLTDIKDKHLPVREPLIAEYQVWFEATQALPASLADFHNVFAACEIAAKTIGFSMTAREVGRFIEKQRTALGPRR